MFVMYERDNSSFKHLFKVISVKCIYSGYRNHIQKDTLQENVKFRAM